MDLRELLARPDAPPVDITALALDDRLVEPGTLFFCVPGFTRDGHDFAPQAVARGATALVVQRPLGLGAPEVLVDDVRAAMAPAAARLHGDPTARLRTVGITGTSGKTTTSYLVRSLLEAHGEPTGLLGTVETIVGGEARPAVRTTPEAIDLQRTFAAMLEAGDRAAVMEVSSHALELHRADAIHWAAAAFLNLSPEHLDFHPDMEAYFAAKRRLFEAQPGVRVVNADDAYGRRLADGAITVGIDGGNLRATDLRPDPSGTSFRAGGMQLRVPLPGRFNVLNALVAVAIAQALGVPEATIERALPEATTAPGRFEPVDEGQPFAVIVDYAHKPDALAAVLRAARDLAADGRVLAVFGAGGDRDRAKRPLMGAAASQAADRVVVTSDNPRNEDPAAIVAEVLEGIDGSADVVLDRRRAIEHAIGLAEAGDVVVIAGKGHETYQELEGGRTIPFDDRVVAREALRARLVA
jgi:UDP-N-acetylmuramoyl-L-alanyl-D-glutamate--2,6-diaminopimelate ligase